MQYVQGGGCTSVGVIGWHIGGGYGSWSKKFGTGPANMLEARVVTANGEVVVASEYQNEDLFYALRGGGFGFGVVVSLTVRTHPLPELFGFAMGSVHAKNEESAKDLIASFLEFYKLNLLGTNWGEQFSINPEGNGGRLDISMSSVDLTEEEMNLVWQPFWEWVDSRPQDFTYEFSALEFPARSFWDTSFNVPLGFANPTPYDPKEPERGFFWKANEGEISAYWMFYISRFLRMDQILDDTRLGMEKLVALVKGTGSGIGIHTNKAQYGASEWAVKELEKTPMHPSIKGTYVVLSELK